MSEEMNEDTAALARNAAVTRPKGGKVKVAAGLGIVALLGGLTYNSLHNPVPMEQQTQPATRVAVLSRLGVNPGGLKVLGCEERNSLVHLVLSGDNHIFFGEVTVDGHRVTCKEIMEAEE